METVQIFGNIVITKNYFKIFIAFFKGAGTSEASGQTKEKL